MADKTKKKSKKKSNFKDEFRGIVGVNPRLNPAVTAAAAVIARLMSDALYTAVFSSITADDVSFVGRCRRLGQKSRGSNLFTVESVGVYVAGHGRVEARRDGPIVAYALCSAVEDYMRLYFVKPPRTKNSWSEYAEAALATLTDVAGFWCGTVRGYKQLPGAKEATRGGHGEPAGAGDGGAGAAGRVPAHPVA
jgi:hypothetical protein